MKLKSVTTLMLAMTLASGPALATFCGCSSAPITLQALSQAQRASPVAWEAPAVQDAERDLDLLLLDYDVAFQVDYADMTMGQREAQYARLNDLRLQRIAAIERVALAYEAAGARRVSIDILRGHELTLNVETKDAVAVLNRLPELMVAGTAKGGDAYAKRAAGFVQEACDVLKQPTLDACMTDAVANSDKYSAGHLTKYAWVAGPLLVLDNRLKQLRDGSELLPSS